MKNTPAIFLRVFSVALLITPTAVLAQDRPNILAIWGDDIGYWNVGAYNRGAMSYDMAIRWLTLCQ